MADKSRSRTVNTAPQNAHDVAFGSREPPQLLQRMTGLVRGAGEATVICALHAHTNVAPTA